MAKRHHARRIRGIHTRYCLVLFNVVALLGLTVAGVSLRSQEIAAKSDKAELVGRAAADQAAFDAIADSADQSQLLPPTF